MKFLINKAKPVLGFFIMALFFSSCSKDYLNTLPTDAISEADAFKTTDNAWAALNGMHRLLYRQYYSSQALGGQSGNMIYMDALGEDLVMTARSTGWFINEYAWINHRNPNSTIVYYNYLFYYTFVSNANMIIANIDKAEGPEQDKKTIKGQALAYRAWAYFQMIQLFGERFVKGSANDGLGLPIVLQPAAGAVPRSTVAEVYTQINKDIDEAIASLTGAPARSNRSHININVAKGLKARIALTQQDYVTAAQMAKEARQGFTLMSDAQYLSGFNDYNNPEWMWGIHQQEDQTTYFYSFFAFMSANYSSSNIRGNPKAINSKLYNMIATTDVRKKLWDPTGSNTSFPIPPNGSRFPYMNRKFLVANPALSIGDLPLMRASEMILIQAEALARQGSKDAEAAQVLFELANKRDPNYTLSTNTGQALIDEIMIQRRVELWGEGFRFYDLKRTNTALDRNGANHNVSLAVVYDVPANDKRWQFLIPQDEINNTNGVVVQNPL